ncbi:MAG TPA: glycosyltransferase [Burkholderiales bacterium]|nr:glycosyltransferase [Burkholderiales bacterium]
MTPPRPVVLLLGPSRGAISGVSTHVNALLASALGREFELEHFQVGSEGRTEERCGRLGRLAAGPFALAAAILRRQAAIVHVNTSLNARAFWRDLAYVLVAKLCGARVLYQVHGGALREFSAGWKFVLRALVTLPNLAVVLSRVEHAAWREIVPGQDVAVVPNGIDCAPYRMNSRPRREPEAPLELVYIGRLAPRKGLAEAIAAVALARDAGVAARLVIAGAGPEEQLLRQQVQSLGLESAVSFSGPAYGAGKAKLLGEADALLLASHAEGLPYALLEAMAAGVVPVVTPVGGIPDVVQPGLHGLMVPVGDAQAIAAAIGALSRDRERLALMSAACRERIAQAYSIDRAAQDFGALYHKLESRSWAPSRAG